MPYTVPTQAFNSSTDQSYTIHRRLSATITHIHSVIYCLYQALRELTTPNGSWRDRLSDCQTVRLLERNASVSPSLRRYFSDSMGNNNSHTSHTTISW